MTTTETSEPSAIDKALAGIRDEIKEREAARDSAADTLKGVEREIRRLRTAERALDPSVKGLSRTPGAPRETTADAVRTIMLELGTATQHQVMVALGKPKNSAKHALERLVDEGFIRATGELEKRSPVFTLVDSGGNGNGNGNGHGEAKGEAKADSK